MCFLMNQRRIHLKPLILTLEILKISLQLLLGMSLLLQFNKHGLSLPTQKYYIISSLLSLSQRAVPRPPHNLQLLLQPPIFIPQLLIDWQHGELTILQACGHSAVGTLGGATGVPRTDQNARDLVPFLFETPATVEQVVAFLAQEEDFGVGGGGVGEVGRDGSWGDG